MTKEEYRKAIDEVIYLSGCTLRGETPDKEKVVSLNIQNLYQAANKHNLCAIIGYALESAGVFDNSFIQAKAKSIRKVAAMEIDKELLFERFEEEKIWYLPLKGIIIKDLYPSIGMRQMADFDILFDDTYCEKVRDIFLELGFTSERYGEGNHDVYFKKPVSNFEMHTALFGESQKKEIYEYYRDVKSLMLKDDGNEYGYHLSSNDFYVYITAHEYKHYSGGGTGLRSLTDTYIIWKKLGEELDTDYIRSQTDMLDITDFEQKNKKLALSLFSGKTLSGELREMLEYIIFSGTYGTLNNTVMNKVEKYGGGKKGRRKYIMSRLFLSMDEIKKHHPFFYKHKILIPCLTLHRIWRAATVSRRKVKEELRIFREKR